MSIPNCHIPSPLYRMRCSSLCMTFFVFALSATKNYGMQMGYSYTVLVLYPLSSPALLTLRIG